MKKLLLGLGLLALLGAFAAWALLKPGATYAPIAAPPSPKTAPGAAAASTPPPLSAQALAKEAEYRSRLPLPDGVCETLYTRLHALDTAQLSDADKTWLQETLDSRHVLASYVIIDYLTCESLRLRSPAIPEFKLPESGVSPRGIQLLFVPFFDFSARKMQPAQVEEGFADFSKEERERIHAYLAALSAQDPTFCQSLEKAPDLKAFCRWSVTRKDEGFPKAFKPFLEALASGQRGFILQMPEKYRLYPYSLIDTLMGDAGACKTMLEARKEELCQKKPYASMPE